MTPIVRKKKLTAARRKKGIPRSDVTRKLWADIKTNGLPDKTRKRMINADEILGTIFKGKSVFSK